MIMNMVVAGLLLLNPNPNPNPNTAGGGGGVSSVEARGSQSGRKAEISLKNSQIIISGNGRGGRSDGYRLKRPCWYEPSQNAEEMLDFQQRSTRVDPDAPQSRQETLKPFVEKLGEEGRWWTVAHDSSDPNGVSCQMALDTYVFVPPGTTPPAGITMAELVDIARAALTVPEPKIELNPDAKSYVNLPTWVWLSGIGETTRSVTATLPGIMSATVTATLEDIQIDAGTTADRAEVKEECGPGGKPYAKGAAFTCGVRYLRASIDQPRDAYVLTVTSVWPIEIEDDVVPFAYDPIEVGVTRDVPVGEVQSTVRKTG
ncbi:hypothetical protein OIE13_25120 [Streptosporangium sp. NBC_01810]|uniref:hypothetical protein n=1 Tax=Streptosporangium sp. NBC_01810 TaxID=2975951 RepID=UPI002DDC230E|nr:hypothetical protein [Streptosporangium sp. NBC_01810]WSA24206.1 hypothetical protein OIE13_25120 [Streptosporangium sp. NBC_01810]